MESLLDHVARKKKRSKLLINSATKQHQPLNCYANTDRIDEVTQNSVATSSNATATNVPTNKPISTNEKKVLKSDQTTVGRAWQQQSHPSPHSVYLVKKESNQNKNQLRRVRRDLEADERRNIRPSVHDCLSQNTSGRRPPPRPRSPENRAGMETPVGAEQLL
uniref:Uncharacterized protein n=1 Tax=Glossina pallidipes TaxID=7398 RepID=A0A1B0A5M7_GLOPL